MNRREREGRTFVCMDDSTGPGIRAEVFDPDDPALALEEAGRVGDPGSTAADILREVAKYRVAGRSCSEAVPVD